MSLDAFARIAAEYDEHGTGWYAAWMAARQRLDHAWGRGNYNIAAVGWHAWRELAHDQQYLTLNQLFHDYFVSVHEEERELQLQTDVADCKTYLVGGWEQASLEERLGHADIADEDAEVTVSAMALHRILSELDLLQFRLRDQAEPKEGER